MRLDKQKGRKGLSFTLSFIFTLTSSGLLALAILVLRYTTSTSLLILLPVYLLLASGCAAIILTRTEGSKTLKDVKLDKKISKVRTLAIRWFEQKKFESIEKNAKIVAARRHGIIFEIMLKGENDACLMHGEFYTMSWPMLKLDLREKAFIDGHRRREGFRLMNEFLDFLKEG